MKLHYYPETDSLYIELVERPGADVREIGGGIVVDVDEHGDPVGIDIDGASRRLDLGRIDVVALPTPIRRAG